MLQGLLAALLAVSAHAAAPVEPNADVRALLKQASLLPSPPTPGWTENSRWLEGCKTLVLAPGEATSPRFTLFSAELVRECDFDPRTGMRCHETFGRTERRATQLLLVGRPTDAPSETFQVCLRGSELYMALIGGPTRYDAAVGPTAITLTAK